MAKHPELRGILLDVRIGWFRLCDDLVAAIVPRAFENADGAPVVFHQIKSEFAELRCFVDSPVPVGDLVQRAWLRSALICEYCGAIGRLRMQRPMRLVRPSCDACEFREDLGTWRTLSLLSACQVRISPRKDGFLDVSLVIESGTNGKDVATRTVSPHPEDTGLAVAYLMNRLQASAAPNTASSMALPVYRAVE